jgi:hypothetical protein
MRPLPDSGAFFTYLEAPASSVLPVAESQLAISKLTQIEHFIV